MAKVIFTGPTPQGGIIPGTGLGAGLSSIADLINQRNEDRRQRNISEALQGTFAGTSPFADIVPGTEGAPGGAPGAAPGGLVPSPETAEFGQLSAKEQFFKRLQMSGVQLDEPILDLADKAFPEKDPIQLGGKSRLLDPDSFEELVPALPTAGPEKFKTLTTAEKAKLNINPDFFAQANLATNEITTKDQSGKSVVLKPVLDLAATKKAGKPVLAFKTPEEIVASKGNLVPQPSGISLRVGADGSVELSTEGLGLPGGTQLERQVGELKDLAIVTQNLTGAATAMIELVQDNPQALATPGLLARFILSTTSQIEGFINLGIVQTGSEKASVIKGRLTDEDRAALKGFTERFLISGKDAALVQGRLIDLAFLAAATLAKQEGRAISDIDFKNFIKRIGNSGSPDIFVSNLEDVIASATRNFGNAFGVITRGLDPSELSQFGLTSTAEGMLGAAPGPRAAPAPAQAGSVTPAAPQLPAPEEIDAMTAEQALAARDRLLSEMPPGTEIPQALFDAFLRKLPAGAI